MSNQPPFTITSGIIDLIRAISEQVGFVQRDFLFPPVNAPQSTLVNSNPVLLADHVCRIVREGY